MTEEIKVPIIKEPDYSVKITGHKDYTTIDIHYYYTLSNDVSFDIANQMTVDAYRDCYKRLKKEGFIVAPPNSKDD